MADSVVSNEDSNSAIQSEASPVAETCTSSDSASNLCSSSWLDLGSWMSYAKEQTSTVLEKSKNQSSHVWGFVKRDMAEFVSTVKEDSKQVYQTVKNSDKSGSNISSGLTKIVSTVANAMYIPPDDGDEEVYEVHNGKFVNKDWESTRLSSLKSDLKSFATDPQGKPDEFLSFMKSFQPDDYKSEISELLLSSSELRALYSQLVPAEISHLHFWSRYYFRMKSIHEESLKREALKKRAEELQQVTNKDEHGINWDEEESDEFKPQADSTTVKETIVRNSEQEEFRMSDRDNDTVVVRHAGSSDNSESDVAVNVVASSDTLLCTNNEKYSADTVVESTTHTDTKNSAKMDNEEDEWENWD